MRPKISRAAQRTPRRLSASPEAFSPAPFRRIGLSEFLGVGPDPSGDRDRVFPGKFFCKIAAEMLDPRVNLVPERKTQDSFGCGVFREIEADAVFVCGYNSFHSSSVVDKLANDVSASIERAREPRFAACDFRFQYLRGASPSRADRAQDLRSRRVS